MARLSVGRLTSRSENGLEKVGMKHFIGLLIARSFN